MVSASFSSWVSENLPVPTEIQSLAWPVLRKGGNALLVAPTGTGKTEAAMVPILEDLTGANLPPIALLYVSPLRALNRDLEGRLFKMSQAAGLVARARHGDTPQSERTKMSKNPPDILITTPETLQLLLIGKNLRNGLANVTTVIVDEVHELASSDRGGQLALSLTRLEKLTGRKVRRIGLSATVGNTEEMARFLSLNEEVTVVVAPPSKRFKIEVTVPKAKEEWGRAESMMRPGEDERFLKAAFRIVDEIRTHESSLIFTNTRPAAETLVAYLRRLAPDLSTAVHHGSLSREAREEAEREFRGGKLKGLVATSSLELGIDIGAADHVVQFGSPHRVARLLQRVGRSGHSVGRTSSGTVVALDGQDLEEAAVIARRALSGLVEDINVRRKNGTALAQQMVALVRERGRVTIPEVLAISDAALSTRDFKREEVRGVAETLSRIGILRLEGEVLSGGRGAFGHFYATISLIPEEKSYTLRDIGTRRLIGTLDERFVLTRVMTDPDYTFLLHGTTWKMVKLTDDELLVEPVKDMGNPPHWEGDDIPVPQEVAQEIGRLRREQNLEDYPLTNLSKELLRTRLIRMHSAEAYPSDKELAIEVHGRLVVVGSCFGTNANNALSAVMASLFTEKLGLRVDVSLVTPVWFVLAMPGVVGKERIREIFSECPANIEERMRKVIVQTEEYRWSFVVVARKFGLLSPQEGSDTARRLVPLMEAYENTSIGEEAFTKTVHEKFDVDTAKDILSRISSGGLGIAVVDGNQSTPGAEALERMRWQEVPGRPPPTLLKAVRERLAKEELVTICLRCGNVRTLTPKGYSITGGSPCLSCKAVMTAVLSPRRRKDIETLSKYLSSKRAGKLDMEGPARRRWAKEKRLLSSAHLSAELVATYGRNALVVLAGRGIGPETAKRILSRGYESADDLIAEVLRAEKNYARTRDFWQ